MADLTMKRGDDRTVVFTFAGATTFVAGDVVRFTVKRSRAHTDAQALVAKTSADGGVTFVVGGNTATAEIPKTATAAFTGARDVPLLFDWQLTTALGKTRTIDDGIITVEADVTRTAP